jgi:FkbM family methyltransferase
MSLTSDPYWTATAEFLQSHVASSESIIAPARFKTILANVLPYDTIDHQAASRAQWIVIHKGLTDKLNPVFLQQVSATLQPVFANEVFIVLTHHDNFPALVDPRHSRPWLQAYANRSELAPSATSGIAEALKTIMQKVSSSSSEKRALAAINQRLDRLERKVNQNLQTLRSLKKMVRQPPSALGLRSATIADWSIDELVRVSRAACQTSYLGDGIVLCRVLAKFMLYADTQDVGIAPHLYMNGYWEGWMTLAVARLLQPGWYCLDIGANHGYYTLVMADGVKETGRVLAIEPNPKLASLVQRTVQVNNLHRQTTVLAKAVAKTDGERLNLVIPAGFGMNASIVRAVSPTDELVEVETITIDSLTAAWDRVDLIKIDAEGAEESIWDGMQQTLQRHPNVKLVLEFNAARYPDSKAFLQKILAVGFPLRYITHSAEIADLSLETCLTEQYGQDWLLYLSRD